MATVAFQSGYAQANPGPGRLQRIVQQPLLIGLVAAGGAGIYAWSALTGPAGGMDQFAPPGLPAAPQLAQVPATTPAATLPEVKFLTAPVTAAAPLEAARPAPARLAAVQAQPAVRAPKPALAPKLAPVPAAPTAARSPAPDYSYVNRVVLPAPPPLPVPPSRTVRVEMPPPAPVAAQPRRITGSFAAPSLQPLTAPGIEPVSAQLAAPQPLLAPMQPLQPVAPGAVSAAPLQLAPAQPVLTPEPLGVQAAPLAAPSAAAPAMGASPLLGEPQTAPQLAPSAPAAQPLQTAPGAAATDPAALSAAGFHKLDDAQLSGIKPISGPGKQSGRAAMQAEPAAAPAAAPAKQGESAQASPLDKIIGGAIDLRVPVETSGGRKGELPVRIGANGKAAVRLGELLSLFGDSMEAGTLAALSSSPAMSSYVGFDVLRAAGIDAAYEAARNEVRLSARSA